ARRRSVRLVRKLCAARASELSGQRVPTNQARSTSRPGRRVSRARIQCPLRERRRGRASPFTQTWNGPNRLRTSGADVGHDIFTPSGLPLPGGVLAPPEVAFRYRVTLFLAARVLCRDARLVECGLRSVARPMGPRVGPIEAQVGRQRLATWATTAFGGVAMGSHVLDELLAGRAAARP